MIVPPVSRGRRLPRAQGVVELFRLVRPLNVVMMLAGAAVGGVLAAGGTVLAPPVRPSLLLAMASAAAIGAAANAINDVYDLEIDRVNRPTRPLPSGAVTVQAARRLWMALSVLGGVLAALVSLLHLVLAVSSVLLLLAYSARLKRMPFAGNLAVATVIGLAFPFGGLAVGGEIGGALLGGVFAFGSTFAREVAKDMEDVEGDTAGQARTAPIVFGPTVVAWASAGAALLTIAVLPLGQAAGLPASFLVLGLPVAGLLLAAAWTVLGVADGEPGEGVERARRASALLKGGMVVGLGVLAVAAW